MAQIAAVAVDKATPQFDREYSALSVVYPEE